MEISKQKHFNIKLKLCLWKRYLEVGHSLANYLLYALLFFGIITRDVKNTMYLFVVYLIFCFFLGWYWVNYSWLSAEIEVSNRLNPFVHEMRKKIG